jgi:ABC-2 type transport system ATP-binding protein
VRPDRVHQRRPIVAQGSSRELADTYGVASLEDAYLELVGRKELSRAHILGEAP